MADEGLVLELVRAIRPYLDGLFDENAGEVAIQLDHQLVSCA